MVAEFEAVSVAMSDLSADLDALTGKMGRLQVGLILCLDMGCSNDHDIDSKAVLLGVANTVCFVTGCTNRHNTYA
jgi:hypothetical protein